jgi:hypothetical protein
MVHRHVEGLVTLVGTSETVAAASLTVQWQDSIKSGHEQSFYNLEHTQG